MALDIGQQAPDPRHDVSLRPGLDGRIFRQTARQMTVHACRIDAILLAQIAAEEMEIV